ncbi:hypothetical protein SOVF_123320 [Spinacia oleracea]|nr:hypothetical protein SOVF_123320 [Spinacia oleracea]
MAVGTNSIMEQNGITERLQVLSRRLEDTMAFRNPGLIPTSGVVNPGPTVGVNQTGTTWSSLFQRSPLTGNDKFVFTAICGLHTIEDRRKFWTDLGGLKQSTWSTPWLISGDFNSVLDVQDRINRTDVTVAEIKDFNEFIDNCEFFESKSSGHFYSWHKGGDGNKTASRIDRSFGNAPWMSQKGVVCTEYLNPGISDHSPLLITCLPEDRGGGRPFKFFNYLVDHPEFILVVENSWNEVHQGSMMLSVWERLK